MHLIIGLSVLSSEERMVPMRLAPKVILTDEQRTLLMKWSRGRSTPSRLVRRAQIVLLAAEGKDEHSR